MTRDNARLDRKALGVKDAVLRLEKLNVMSLISSAYSNRDKVDSGPRRCR